MAAKPTKGTPSAADAALGDVSQSTAAAPAAAALPQDGPAVTGEQTGDQSAAPATTAPGAPDADTATAEDGVNQPAAAAPTAAVPASVDDLAGRLDEFRAPIDLSAVLQPTLSGYLVTDVSSVLHDGTWYHLGDEIFLNDKEADPLLDRRIIEPSGSKK
ncbi:hypothetical protein [Pseudomonas chlororaphis]|uniref:hypothetical protein n=1 Tax=Pseudomonas chlororaphis TaxID=587753 RepID=UPI0012681258|nr:hypothetical protein [Pseudomonas chlororaphis]